MNGGILQGTNGINLLNPNKENFSDWVDFPKSIWLPGTAGWNTATMTLTRYKYKKIGSLVFLNIYIVGTSNLAGLTVTVPLPFKTALPGPIWVPCVVTNTTTIAGLAVIGATATPKDIVFYNSLAATTAWGATGTKGVYLSAWYITNE